MNQHAIYSPSGEAGWRNCSEWASDPEGSKHADLGTDAHELAAMCLTNKKAPAAYRGRIMGKGNAVNDEMIEAVEQYLAIVLAIPGELLVEQRVPISQITGEDDAEGTSDVVILTDDEIVVIDLKYGKGVRVDLDTSDQLKFYAHGALTKYDCLAEFKQVRMMIVQPRINHVDEQVMSVEALEEWSLGVKIATEIQPGAKQCQWCAKKATCPAIRQQVINMFENIQPVAEADDLVLASAMAKIDMIESWAKSIRAEVERRLLDGKTLPGWKLVQGKKGNRAWDDEKIVEALLKDSMRLRQGEMYQFKLISPTQAEKVLKPKQWERITAHITQSAGSPSVAPASDKRPAINVANVAEQFDTVL